MKTLALLVAAVIVFAIVVSNLGYGPRVFAFVDRVPGGDLTGHFGLFGLLGFAACSAAAARAGGPSRRTVAAVLAALIALEELSQSLIPARTFSLSDLAASLCGLAAGAAASAWFSRLRRSIREE